MAPAIIKQHLESPAIEPIEHVVQAATLKGIPRITSWRKKTCTKTQTKIVTVKFVENNPMSTSRSPQESVVSSDIESFQWPVPYGIIPGPLSILHSPAVSTMLSNTETLENTSQTQLPSSTTFSRRSAYPRPSPPVFLYPQAIVPLTAYERQLTSMQPPEFPNKTHSAMWYLPYGLEVLIFTAMFLGFAWAILVCLINYPPRTWNVDHLERNWNGRRCWWSCLIPQRLWNKGNDHKVERRPIDKPPKLSSIRRHQYAEQEDNVCSATATTSSAHVPRVYLHKDTHIDSGFQGIELTHRSHHRRQQSLPICNKDRCFYSSPETAVRFHLPLPAIKTLSNPYLRPPNEYLSHQVSALNTPSSPEWLAERATFFSPIDDASPRTPSLHSSKHSSVDDHDEYALMDIADIEALEAGLAPLTRRTATKQDRKGSWVDLGLGKVEDVVSELVGRLARWTDGEGGEEGLLLPMINGRKRGIKDI